MMAEERQALVQRDVEMIAETHQSFYDVDFVKLFNNRIPSRPNRERLVRVFLDQFISGDEETNLHRRKSLKISPIFSDTGRCTPAG
jgi:hypothetical protein